MDSGCPQLLMDYRDTSHPSHQVLILSTHGRRDPIWARDVYEVGDSNVRGVTENGLCDRRVSLFDKGRKPKPRVQGGLTVHSRERKTVRTKVKVPGLKPPTPFK